MHEVNPEKKPAPRAQVKPFQPTHIWSRSYAYGAIGI